MLKMFVHYFTLNWKLNFQKYHNFFALQKFCMSIVFSFSWDFKFLPDTVIYINNIAYESYGEKKEYYGTI